MAGRRVKWSEIWESGGVRILILGTYIWPCRVQSYFGVIWCFCLKMSYISKTACRRAKWSEIWESGTLVAHMGYIWPCSVQGHVGVIHCTFLKMSWNSKTAGCRVKLTEIWDSGTLVILIWVTFDLVGFKVILESFGVIIFFKWQ